MLGYQLDDFQRYFSGAFIRTPGGKIGELRRAVERPSVFSFRGKEGEFRADMSTVKWEDVVPPDLGYVNAGDLDDLYYVSKKPGRNTAKGLSVSTLSINPALVTSVCTAPGSLPLQDIAQKLFYPQYTAYEDAVEMLKDPKQRALGYALSASVAVALDPGSKNGLILLIDEGIVGRKKWGESWEFTAPHALDIAKRLGVK